MIQTETYFEIEKRDKGMGEWAWGSLGEFPQEQIEGFLEQRRRVDPNYEFRVRKITQTHEILDW